MNRRALEAAPVLATVLTLGWVAAALADQSAGTPGSAAITAPMGRAITYQGKVDKNGTPVNGTCNFKFHLYDALALGNEINAPGVTLLAQTVTNGLFTVSLDFGANAFDGSARWLGIEVQGAGDAGYTALAPRSAITAAPYALYALNSLSGSPNQWVSDGVGNITYSGGAAGITGQSTHLATGKGVFFDGGNATSASVYGYNYDILQPLTLYLNPPGGSVCVGAVTTPAAKLDVLSSGGPGIQSITKGSSFFPVNAALRAIGNTGTGPSGVSCMGVHATSTDDRAVAGFSTNNWGVSGDCTSAGTYGILGTPSEGVFGSSPNAAKPAGRFVNTAAGGLALEAVGTAKVKVLQITGGADLAERFEVSDATEPGTVLAIDPRTPGRLEVCGEAYSPRVAGVVSGARDLQAGVVLGQSQPEAGERAKPSAAQGRDRGCRAHRVRSAGCGAQQAAAPGSGQRGGMDRTDLAQVRGACHGQREPGYCTNAAPRSRRSDALAPGVVEPDHQCGGSHAAGWHSGNPCR